MKKENTDHLQTGFSGEEQAGRYLLANGYEILEHNWRFRKAEVDIIARINGILVFVEVKTRKNNIYGYPEESVGPHKENMLAKAAGEYIYKSGHQGEIRFDIIAITLEPTKELHHIEDAFFPGL